MSIQEMTMHEIITEAKKRGFTGNECTKSFYSCWEESVECQAYAFLQEIAPEFFEN